MTKARIVRLIAALYAILAAFGGALVLAFIGILIGTFGTNGLRSLPFLFYFVLPGVACIVLSPFIWKGRRWAMIAALAIAVGLAFVFSTETLELRWSARSVAALFAVFTGIRFWLGKDA